MTGSPELDFVLSNTFDCIFSEPEILTQDRNCVQVSYFAASLFNKLSIEAIPVEASAVLQANVISHGEKRLASFPIGTNPDNELGWAGHMVILIPSQKLIWDLTLGFQPDPNYQQILSNICRAEGIDCDVVYYANLDETNTKGKKYVGNGIGEINWTIYPDAIGWKNQGGPYCDFEKIEELAIRVFQKWQP